MRTLLLKRENNQKAPEESGFRTPLCGWGDKQNTSDFTDSPKAWSCLCSTFCPALVWPSQLPGTFTLTFFENPSHGIYLRYTFSVNPSQLFWHSGPGTDRTDALFPISMEKCKKFDYRDVGALLNLYRITRFVMSHVFHFLHFVISGCSFAAHFKPPVRRGRRKTTFRLQIVIPQTYFTCGDGSETRVILSEPQREAKKSDLKRWRCC